MSVLEFLDGDMFILRTIKKLAANPENKWANSYEFVAHANGDSGLLITLASAVVLFEQTMSLSTVLFDHAIISTWEADSVPYDPASFISIPLTGGGANIPATDPLPLSQCLSVARVPTSGRYGHIFYRGWLKEGDVSAPAGIPILGDQASLQSDLDDALTSSEFLSYFIEDNATGIHFAMIPANGESSRVVQSMVISGVSQLPLDHAWFNRTTPSP